MFGAFLSSWIFLVGSSQTFGVLCRFVWGLFLLIISLFWISQLGCIENEYLKLQIIQMEVRLQMDIELLNFTVW